jgi:hypothetical protein
MTQLGCVEVVDYPPPPLPHYVRGPTPNDPLASMPLWVYRATVRANALRPRPRLSHTLSLGYSGDEPLTGGVMQDGTVPYPLPEDDDE